MNELIKVTYENDRPTVSGRDLHEKLGISTRYNDWFSRVCEYGFTENEDYIAITQKRVTAQVNKTTKVTGKGQLYFVNVFLAEKDEPDNE